MIFDYIFRCDIIEKGNYDFNEKTSQVIIPISDGLVGEKIMVFKKLNSIPVQFCFEIDCSWIKSKKPSELTESFSAIINLLFLPNYLKYAGSHLFIINVSGTAPDDVAPLLSLFQKILERQGITRTYFEIVENTFTNRHNDTNKIIYCDNAVTDLLVKNPDDATMESMFSRLVSYSSNRKLLVPIENNSAIGDVQVAINSFEEWSNSHHRSSAHLLEMLASAKHDVHSLEVENRKLRFKLNNHEDYLRIVKETTVWHVNEYNKIVNLAQSNARVNEVQGAPPELLFKIGDMQNKIDYLESNRQNIIDWYNKEYEVLPLWYKRFGHIIKVLMGKRKFKSLFK